MKTRIALGIAVGLIAAICIGTAGVNAAILAESSFDRTLEVSGPVTLSVSTASGGVHVHAGTDRQIHIVAHVRADDRLTQSEADAAVKQIAANPPIRQMGSMISIGPDREDPLYHNIGIEYDIVTPKQTTLTAKSGSGNIQVADLAQEVNALTGSGDVQADNIGTKVKLATGSGSVHAHGIAGDADVSAGSGTIELQQSVAGDVHARTGSGSIHIDGAKKALIAETGSGSITVSGAVSTSGWRLRTGSGRVTLDLGSTARFTLDAQSSNGGIHLEQPILMQGSLNNHHIHGAVNGGGPEVSIETGSGSIEIR